MDAITIVFIVIALLVVVGGLWAVATYNGFVRLRNLVQESWRQIDVELHRRHDLIPNLIETVKGYAAHERGVFEAVTAATCRLFVTTIARMSGSSRARQRQVLPEPMNTASPSLTRFAATRPIWRFSAE